MENNNYQKIVVVDLGSQATHAYARYIRDKSVFCEIIPYNQLPIGDKKILAYIYARSANSPKLDFMHLQTPVIELTDLVVSGIAKSGKRIKIGEEWRTAIDTLMSEVCQFDRSWTRGVFIENSVTGLKQTLADDKVILALSGGVDSTVCAALLNRAIGENLICVFVNTGLLRKGEYEQVMESYIDMGLNITGVDASELFLGKLKGVSDPEHKRKIIGGCFIEVFEQEARKTKDIKWLAQGTIYPDIIESVGIDGKLAVKSHHNVGGLPEKMNLKIVEPLKLLFKDEVRVVGTVLGLSPDILKRHPFPGPGLGIRILGEVTKEKVKLLQEADHIYIDMLKKDNLYDKVWQAGAILLPVQSVGVTDGARSYEYCLALRAVESVDGMTAKWVDLPYQFLANVSNSIVKEVKGINRVVYDISSKPPATIEWE